MQRRGLLLAATATLLAVSSGYGQSAVPPHQKVYLEAGNIRSSINTLGNMWYNTGNNEPECEYPKGSGKHIGYASGLWVGGKVNDTVVTAAVLYHSNGRRDYFPGILTAGGTSDTALMQHWNRIWTIRRSTIDSFRAVVRSVGTANPTALAAALTSAGFDDLKAWPAKGSATILGRANQPLSLPPGRDYAPFVDVDGDGKYNYLAGDYPKMKGEQMLWTAFNDMADVKTQSGSKGMGLEVHLSAYAYARGTKADDIQFYEYKVHNYGPNAMDSVRVAIWSDGDLGYYADDYIGFDSGRRIGYVYNAKTVDGNGAPGHYGANPPIAGIVLLKAVGDYGRSRVPTGAFSYFSSNTGGTPHCATSPGIAPEFYNLMSGTDRCGQPFLNPITGQATTTIFSGNPANAAEWSECSQYNPPGDRRFILSSAPFQMAAGAVAEVAFALVVSPNAGGCPSVDISGLQQTADTAYYLYDHPAYATSVKDLTAFSGIVLSPNPAGAELRIQNVPVASPSVRVMDITGKVILLPTEKRGTEIVFRTATLAPGVYLLQISNGEATEIRRFVKE